MTQWDMIMGENKNVLQTEQDHLTSGLPLQLKRQHLGSISKRDTEESYFYSEGTTQLRVKLTPVVCDVKAGGGRRVFLYQYIQCPLYFTGMVQQLHLDHHVTLKI